MPLKKEVNENKEPSLEGQVVDLKGETVPLFPHIVTKVVEVDWYYKDVTIRTLYNIAPYLTLNFRNDKLPKRCNEGYGVIYHLLY